MKIGFVVLLTVLALQTLSEFALSAFSSFAEWDDQGYVMLSLHLYRSGAALYDAVFSQYGPAYFMLRDSLYGELPVTHDFTAVVSILHGFACCALLVFIGWKHTNSLLCVLLVALIGPSRVAGFFHECGHPQETIAVLVLLCHALVAARTQTVAWDFAIGVVSAFLILMKVNVGTILFLSLALYYCLRLTNHCSFLIIGTGSALLLFPTLLLWKRLGEMWAMAFALLITVLLAIQISLVTPRREGSSRPGATVWLLSFFGTVLVILLIQVWRGTSTAGLLNGIIFAPAKLPSLFVLPLRFGAADVVFVAASACLFLWIRSKEFTNLAIGAASLAYGALLFTAMALPGAQTFVRAFGPLIWIPAVALLRHQGAFNLDSRSSFLFVSAIILLLQAYPVAGTQTSCGALLFPILAAISVHYGLALLKSSAACSGRPKWAAVVATGAVSACLGVRVFQLGESIANWNSGVPLNLPGASLYRLPESQVSSLQAATRHVAQFDTFISMPGLNSLYFFAEKTPPTGINAGAWMTLFDARTQDRLVKQITPLKSIGAIRNRRLADFWNQTNDVSSKPLVRFIEDHFAQGGAAGDYELLNRIPTTSSTSE